jgi:hypothetical protein
MQLKNEDGSAFLILTYGADVTQSSLCEYIYMLLDAACEMDGYRLTSDLYEMTEEIEAA